jgi:NTE family protein
LTIGHKLEPPGLAAVLGSMFNSQINQYSYETIDLMRLSLQAWAASLPPGPEGRPLKTALVEVSFPLLKDPQQREYFNSMPTSYRLSNEQVDRLIAAARTILRESAEFQQVIKDLGYRSPTSDARASGGF